MHIYSNIVEQKTLHEQTMAVLQIIADSLVTSFGPYGSATQIKKDDILPKFTKDGHTILKNIYFFSCQGNSGINAYKELERIRRNDPFGRIIVHSNKVDGRRLMDHKLQVYGLMELSLSDYGKPDLYYQELDFLLGDLYEELWEMAAEAIKA